MHRREQMRLYLRDSPLLPAPMCNYSDRPFRELMRLMGAHLAYTEMYSSEALVRGDPKTARLMDFRNEAGPIAVQIFGSRVDLMAESARIVRRLGADVIDLNLGCPVKKVRKSGSGSALAENLPNARAIVRAIRQAVHDAPFTVKMRWQGEDETLELARMCQDEGVDAIALHARTRAQGYSGTANWDWIARLKEHARVPVIGNGDARTPADARRMRAVTGCDAVMAGRGLVGNPWFMRDMARGFQGRESTPEFAPDEETRVGRHAEELLPPASERLPVLFDHARLMVDHRGDHGLIEFRKHCAGYIRGLRGARVARPELMQVTTLDQLREVLEKHFGHFDTIS